MRPMSEQDEYNEAVANMQLKLVPKKDFERLLDLYVLTSQTRANWLNGECYDN
jgi:hypothetical protein